MVQTKLSAKRIFYGLIAVAFGIQISIVVFDSFNRRQFEGVFLNELTFEEVFFHNAEQDIDLAGMLFMPSGVGPFPAAVIIHGSGPSIRNNGWYLTLVDHLIQNKVAVLLPDKRGSEKSGGEWRSVDYHDLTTDTVAAVNYLQTREDLAISGIGIIGMSEGGKFAPLVASQLEELDFIVNVVGSAVLPSEQLQFEENYNLQQMGIPPGISYLVALLSTAHIRHIRNPEFWDAVSDFDPNYYWQQVNTDTLILYGEDDTNVPTNESVSRLQALENPQIRVLVFENSGHALEDPPEVGNSIFRLDALEEISQFIAD